MSKQITTRPAGHLTNLEEKRRSDLVLYSPGKCYQHAHKLRTIKDVISIPSKTIGDFHRDYGREWVIGYISMWLIDLNDNAQVKTKMSDASIEATAERIFDEYSLKVTDLTYFFRAVKDGKYGNYFENLSREKIMSWIAEYFDERCEIAAMQNDNQHEKFVATKDKMHPDVAKAMFEGVGEQKVEYTHEKSTLGGRAKKVILKDLIKEIKKKTTKELREYLATINYDPKDGNYSEFVVSLVEQELDNRNKQKNEQ